MAVGLAPLAFSECDGNGICTLHECEHGHEQRHEHEHEHERWRRGNYCVEADRRLH